MTVVNVALVPEGSPEWHQLIIDTVKARWDHELPTEPSKWSFRQHTFATLTDRLIQREYEVHHAKAALADAVLGVYHWTGQDGVEFRKIKRTLLNASNTMRTAELNMSTTYSVLVAHLLAGDDPL